MASPLTSNITPIHQTPRPRNIGDDLVTVWNSLPFTLPWGTPTPTAIPTDGGPWAQLNRALVAISGTPFARTYDQFTNAAITSPINQASESASAHTFPATTATNPEPAPKADIGNPTPFYWTDQLTGRTMTGGQ